jgi:hypothetical protein
VTAAVEHCVIKVFGAGRVDTPQIRQYGAIVPLGKMNADPGLHRRVSLDPSYIHTDLIEFLERKVADYIRSNIAEDSNLSP